MSEPSIQQHGKVTARIPKLTSLVAVALAAIAFVPGAAMAKTIHKAAPTKIRLSATRAVDGTVTATAWVTSPNPHCLEAHRFKRLRDGYYHRIEGLLDYGDGLFAVPPGSTNLSPISAPGRSPFIWQAVWPGAVAVNVQSQSDPELHYKAPVSAALGVDMGAGIGARNGEGVAYIAKYFEGGQKIKVTCKYGHAHQNVHF